MVPAVLRATLLHNIKRTPMQLPAHKLFSGLPTLAPCFKKNCVPFSSCSLLCEKHRYVLTPLPAGHWKANTWHAEIRRSNSKLKNEVALRRNMRPSSWYPMGLKCHPCGKWDGVLTCVFLCGVCFYCRRCRQLLAAPAAEPLGSCRNPDSLLGAMQPHQSSGPSVATDFFAFCGLLNASATLMGFGLLQRSLNKILNFYLCGHLKLHVVVVVLEKPLSDCPGTGISAVVPARETELTTDNEKRDYGVAKQLEKKTKVAEKPKGREKICFKSQ